MYRKVRSFLIGITHVFVSKAFFDISLLCLIKKLPKCKIFIYIALNICFYHVANKEQGDELVDYIPGVSTTRVADLPMTNTRGDS